MATSLDNIINAIKTTALDNGFTSVEEINVNLKSNADTLLDKLFIRLVNINYDKFIVDSVNETYRIELIIIINTSTNPISTLKAKMDNLLNKMFTANTLLSTLSKANKLKLVDANLTNDRDLYSKYGGEGVTLRIDIENMNALGLNSCY